MMLKLTCTKQFKLALQQVLQLPHLQQQKDIELLWEEVMKTGWPVWEHCCQSTQQATAATSLVLVQCTIMKWQCRYCNSWCNRDAVDREPTEQLGK